MEQDIRMRKRKTIPTNFAKKLRSGDNEKMKKITWFKNR
jgi:hypothetical protein